MYCRKPGSERSARAQASQRDGAHRNSSAQGTNVTPLMVRTGTYRSSDGSAFPRSAIAYRCFDQWERREKGGRYKNGCEEVGPLARLRSTDESSP